MTKQFKYEFVNLIPGVINPGIIYISAEYKTAIHLCACGCGNEVVTPLSTHDWSIIFDGDSISLYPSVGNWGLSCQSHYWIVNNKVEWAQKWTRERIKFGREQSKKDRELGRKNSWLRNLFDNE